MVKRTGPSNVHLKELIIALKKHAIEQKTKLWKRVATELEKPARMMRAVNVSRINRHANKGEIVLVPGKVLGSGIITKKVDVCAWSFSKGAEEKIKKAGGRVVSIKQLMKDNPKGKKVRLIG